MKENTHVDLPITINNSFSVRDLAFKLISNNNRESMKNLILQIDEIICDLDFTKDLVDTLVQIIRLDEPDWSLSNTSKKEEECQLSECEVFDMKR